MVQWEIKMISAAPTISIQFFVNVCAHVPKYSLTFLFFPLTKTYWGLQKPPEGGTCSRIWLCWCQHQTHDKAAWGPVQSSLKGKERLDEEKDEDEETQGDINKKKTENKSLYFKTQWPTGAVIYKTVSWSLPHP